MGSLFPHGDDECERLRAFFQPLRRSRPERHDGMGSWCGMVSYEVDDCGSRLIRPNRLDTADARVAESVDAQVVLPGVDVRVKPAPQQDQLPFGQVAFKDALLNPVAEAG